MKIFTSNEICPSDYKLIQQATNANQKLVTDCITELEDEKIEALPFALTRAYSEIFEGMSLVDGLSHSHLHSWLLTDCDKFIIDVCPIGCMFGSPLIVIDPDRIRTYRKTKQGESSWNDNKGVFIKGQNDFDRDLNKKYPWLDDFKSFLKDRI